ncbi:glycoside hydrolase family 18 protein [Paenibacillus sp. CF384]|uniref:glycoside hydrolase family 18 protein n=1 Tax=Paenibacillus sp. CF384 TaxID=1884382 RepID=UPI000897EBDD|nr:glycoside hydrolase family 18 protein [Paenibacillus sp. CF384]SDW56513.1 chitinase [Paenibacillus sp. CF384]
MTATSNYYSVGYVGDSWLPKLSREHALKLTHINIAFAHVVNDEISIGHLKHLGSLPTIKSYNSDIKILLSVGGWSAGGFSEAASTPAGRKRMADTAVAILENYAIDGIDLDWEYPCYGVAGIASSPADKTNFTLLLKELREAIDQLGTRNSRHYMLTIAAGADQYYVDGTEMDQVQRYLDYVQLMTYDMRGGFQTLTGHHTNLFTSTGDLFRISVEASVRMFVAAGVPREKIVIGAAFYSRMWKDVPDINNGFLQMTTVAGGYGPDFTRLANDYIEKNGYKRHWDDEAKAPFLYNGNQFISYEDEESLHHKCQFVKHEGLRGVMFWEYCCDTTFRLLDAIDKGLGNQYVATK